MAHPEHKVEVTIGPERDADGEPDFEWFYLRWQNGPVDEVGKNGVQADEVLGVVLDYLTEVNVEPYESKWTTAAIVAVDNARSHLRRRTEEREARGVEGTSAP